MTDIFDAPRKKGFSVGIQVIVVSEDGQQLAQSTDDDAMAPRALHRLDALFGRSNLMRRTRTFYVRLVCKYVRQFPRTWLH